MVKIAFWINEAIESKSLSADRQAKSVKKIKKEIEKFCKKFPLPK